MFDQAIGIFLFCLFKISENFLDNLVENLSAFSASLAIRTGLFYRQISDSPAISSWLVNQRAGIHLPQFGQSKVQLTQESNPSQE